MNRSDHLTRGRKLAVRLREAADAWSKYRPDLSSWSPRDREGERLWAELSEAAIEYAKDVAVCEAGPPSWIKIGVLADYHAIVSGPVTRAGVVVRSEPFLMCDHWSVMVDGIRGSVACDALTPAQGGEG